jgi:hypothetical protein
LTFEEAEKHPRWVEFNIWCDGSPTVKGFNKWLPQQAPVKLTKITKLKGQQPVNDTYEAALAASQARADADWKSKRATRDGRRTRRNDNANANAGAQYIGIGKI